MNEKTAKLRKLCETLYEDIKQFAREHKDQTTGCNFTYTQKEHWNAEKKILLLTVNPHAKPNEKPCIPDLPWPDKNPFLDNDFNFGIKDRILTILAEIARYKTGNPAIAASCADEKLARFVDDNVILASYVPFRTAVQSGITKDMKAFAKEKYWSRILNVWQPELIIATGGLPFDNLKKFYMQMGWSVPHPHPTKKTYEYHPADIQPFSSGHYSICHCTHPSGMATHLLGVPHPAANRKPKQKSTDTKICGTNYGYPDAKRYPPNEAPIQKFLREQLRNTNF